MKQLNIFCEGPTEQGFCTQVLQPCLFPQGDGIIHTLAVGVKDYRHLYGLGTKKKYMGDKGVRKFICNTIKQRQGKNVYFTTLFDLYALPNDFPGKAANVRHPANPTPYVVALEEALRSDINYHKFTSYLQLHEYETMLFADPDAFRISFENCEEEIQKLKAIAVSEPSLEHIDDGKDTAPSKRIIGVIPEYGGRKSSAGPDIAAFIGLAKIREKCPHVHSWAGRTHQVHKCLLAKGLQKRTRRVSYDATPCEQRLCGFLMRSPCIPGCFNSKASIGRRRVRPGDRR